MSGQPQTIAVVGSSPFALVLAGLLVADHSREVVVVAAAPGAFDVPAPPSLSFAPLTRPETLHIANRNAPEMTRRLARIAPAAVDRIDCVVTARDAYTIGALHHFRHLAAGLDHVVERLAPEGEEAGLSLRMRDVIRFSPAAFMPHAREWSERIGAKWCADPADVFVRRNGSGRCGDTDIDLFVLADDQAILAYVAADEIAEIALTIDCVSYVASAPRTRGEIMLFPDHGVTVSPGRNGAMEIHADDRDGNADGRIGACLPAEFQARRAAARRYRGLATLDGGPLIGPFRRSRAFVISGLGLLDIALTPTLARQICDVAEGEEREWCAQRAPTRGLAGSLAADLAPTRLAGARQ